MGRRAVMAGFRVPLGIAVALLGLLVALLSLQLGGSAVAPPGHGGPVEGHAVVRACWLTASVDASWSGGVLRYSYSLQAPDPCHRLGGVEARVEDGALVLVAEGSSPPPGTFCIQVLPAPVRGGGSVEAPEPVGRVVLVLRDEAAGRICRGEAGLAPGGQRG